MLTNLLPMAGGMAAQNIGSNASEYSTSPDGSYDPMGYIGTGGGALLGGLGGFFGGSLLADKATNMHNVGKYTNRMANAKAFQNLSEKDRAKFKKEFLSKTVEGAEFNPALHYNTAAKEAKGLSGLLSKGKGGVMSSIAKNPMLAKGGGAALGAMLGSKILGNALTHDSHQQTATQMQALAQQDAERQQRNLMALQQPMQVRF